MRGPSLLIPDTKLGRVTIEKSAVNPSCLKLDLGRQTLRTNAHRLADGIVA